MSSGTSGHRGRQQAHRPVGRGGRAVLAWAAVIGAGLGPGPVRAGAALDNAAAEQMLKANNCVKCHTVERKKDGPAYRDVAAKFRPEAGAEQKVIHHMTAGELVKFPDGHEERHKKIKASDEEQVRSLARWILSLEGGTKY